MGSPPNKRIKLMRRRSSALWERGAHSLSAVRWAGEREMRDD